MIRISFTFDYGDGIENNDIETNEYDLGVTSVKLVRIGNVIQIIYSKKLSAEFFYKELAAKYKHEQEQYGGA